MSEKKIMEMRMGVHGPDVGETGQWDSGSAHGSLCQV